jgi:hypothetical protein
MPFLRGAGPGGARPVSKANDGGPPAEEENMAVGHVPHSARRAEWMRETWRPYGERLSHHGRHLKGLLLDRPGLAQAPYYILTGLWPWVHLPSFLGVTGPKADLWLAQTVGLLVVAAGAALAVATWRRERTWSVVTLALGSAAALLFVDVYFVARGAISAIYLLDAAAQAGILALWVAGWRAPDAPLAQERLPVARLATPADVGQVSQPASSRVAG